MNTKKAYPTYFLILPLIIYFIFFIFPSMMGFYYSFTDWNMYSKQINFVGFSNFRDIFDTGNFNIALKNTLMFTAMTTLFKTAFGLVLALLLNLKIRSTNVLRTVNFLPVILSTVIVGVMFTAILKPETGIFNQFLNGIGMNSFQKDWLGDPKYSMWMVNLVEIWKGTGFSMVIFIAALQIIPVDYYEACTIDGGDTFHKLINITLPLIIPAISSSVILSTISGLKVFDIVVLLTNGGPGSSSEVLNTLVFKQFGSGTYAVGCAVSLVLFLFITCISIALKKCFALMEVES